MYGVGLEIDKARRRWIGSLGQGIYLQQFGIGIGVGDRRAFQLNRAKRERDAVTARFDREVSVGDRLLITGREQHILAACSFVLAHRSDTGNRRLPRIDDLAIKNHRVGLGWNL